MARCYRVSHILKNRDLTREEWARLWIRATHGRWVRMGTEKEPGAVMGREGTGRQAEPSIPGVMAGGRMLAFCAEAKGWVF